MPINFNNETFAQWCELYIRIVIKDGQRLAQIIQSCSQKNFQAYLFATSDISSVLAAEFKSDKSYLTAYACLHEFDAEFWQNPHPFLLNGIIEQKFANNRYILVRNDESPIAKAVAEKNRFKTDNQLGSEGTLKLIHRWQEVQTSATIDIRQSIVFDVFIKRKAIKIGLSPFADCDEMLWQYDVNDMRGHGEVPFWCAGAKNEAALSQRLTDVLNIAYQQKIDILLFPELIMKDLCITPLKQNPINT